MGEKEAWTYLAECWSNTEFDGTTYVHGQSWCIGLCASFLWLRRNKMITDVVFLLMENRVEDHREKTSNYWAYLWPTNEAGALQRSEFCKTQAEKL